MDVTFGLPELLIGAITGLTYALLGIGLVLVYRAGRVLHFGYGEIGAFSAIVLAKLVLDQGLSWWVAFPTIVLLGAAISAAFELLIMRRLFNAPRGVVLVATIAIAQVMFGAQLLLPDIRNRQGFPTPLDVEWQLGDFLFRGDHLLVLIVVPAVAVALAWFLNRSIWGVALRGAAENADAARLAGVNVRRLSTLVWGIAGALAATTFVLILPIRGAVLGASSAAVGPGLLLRALAVALVGRMVSLPWAVAGGVLFGIAESGLYANIASPGAVDALVFVTVLLLLLLRGAHGSADDAAALGGGEPTNGSATANRGGALAVGGLLAAAVLVPLVLSDPGRQYTFTRVVIFAVIGMSVTVVAGWSGQLSLCQFAFVGLGAMVTAGLTNRGMTFGWAMFFAMATSAMAAGLVGFPALRIRGLFLAVATLGFAVAAHGWLLDQDVFLMPDGTASVSRPNIGPIDFADQRSYYYLSLATASVVAVLLVWLRRSGVGRTFLAVRENERAASAFTLAPAQVKLAAFALSGAVAGLAGGLLGGLDVTFQATDFGPESSIQVLAMAVIGGVGSLAGAVVGALYVVGIPALLGGGTVVTLMTTGVGLLAVILLAPSGLLYLPRRLHSRRDPPLAAASLPPAAPAAFALASPREPDDADPPSLALDCRGVEVRFGGVVANRSVDLQVGVGEVVGLIGTNGAGKSTLMDAIGGFVPMTGGRVLALGEDVTGWAPHDRARLGVGRVFQDARLFGALTVRDCVLVALEARERSEFFPSLLNLPPARRAARAHAGVADEILGLMHLGDYRDRRLAELSTGTRRICELACLVAAAPRVILLDEPTGGVAQREVEAFATVILDVRRHLDASMLIIEHDMPLIMSLSDRVVCMTAGEVIAAGSPEQIRNDPLVIASYLGTDATAIDRSDAARPSHAASLARGANVPLEV